MNDLFVSKKVLVEIWQEHMSHVLLISSVLPKIIYIAVRMITIFVHCASVSIQRKEALIGCVVSLAIVEYETTRVKEDLKHFIEFYLFLFILQCKM